MFYEDHSGSSLQTVGGVSQIRMLLAVVPELGDGGLDWGESNRSDK